MSSKFPHSHRVYNDGLGDCQCLNVYTNTKKHEMLESDFEDYFL